MNDEYRFDEPGEESGVNSSVSPPAPSGGGSIMFFQIWLLALTRPQEDTFQTIVDDPGASVGRAAIWIFVTSLVSYGIAMTLQFGQLTALMSQMEEAESALGVLAGGGLVVLLCGLPVVAGLAVGGAMVYNAILQFVAGALGGQGSFKDLFFGTASVAAPMTIITTGIGLIPIVGGCLTLPLSLYTAYLNVLVLKSVNRFGWGSAIVTLLVPFILMLLIGLIVAALLLPTMRQLIQSEIGTF